MGADGAYLDRPGFWHGGAGIAACWHGGAVALAQFARGLEDVELAQRERRPLRLPERRATALQFTAHAAIENDRTCCAHMLFTHMLMKITHYQSRSYNYLIRTIRLITTSFFTRDRL